VQAARMTSGGCRQAQMDGIATLPLCVLLKWVLLLTEWVGVVDCDRCLCKSVSRVDVKSTSYTNTQRHHPPTLRHGHPW
jgi:hypothetical protein